LINLYFQKKKKKKKRFISNFLLWEKKKKLINKLKFIHHCNETIKNETLIFLNHYYWEYTENNDYNNVS